MLSEITNRKFIDSIDIDEWEIESDSGFKPVLSIHKTIEYDVWEIKTETELFLRCADTHILFDENFNEIYTKDCIPLETRIITQNGPELVISVEKTNDIENMFDISVNSDDHRYYTNGILSHNTTTISLYYLWCALFNPGDKIGVVANNAKVAHEIIDKVKTTLEHLPLFLQQGILEYNKGNIKFENLSEIRSSATTVNAFRGFSIKRCLIDELAFIDNELANQFYESIYPTISTSKHSQISITSTPKGINNLFYKLWQDAITKKNNFVPFEIRWDEVPGRDEKFKEETIKNIGEVRWRQEFCCHFIGEIGSLISPDVLQSIPYIDPIEINNSFYKYKEPVKATKDTDGHIYIACVDSGEGVGLDYSVVVIIDISTDPYEVVGIYRSNSVSPKAYPAIVHELAKHYNDAHLLIENNSIGYVTADSLISDFEYENILYTHTVERSEKISGGFAKNASNCLRMTSRTKALGCSTLKTLIEGGNLITNDFNLFAELTSFVRVGSSFQASTGSTDDIVMCLVMFSWLTQQEYFKELISEINPVKTKNSSIEESDDENITPFGYISNGVDDFDDSGFDFNW